MYYYIQRNSINKILETAGATKAYFLLEFINDNSCENFTAIFTNTISCNSSIIEIEEVCPDEVDVENGKIHLNQLRYWTVKVYEQDSDTNLDVNNADFIKETKAYIYLEGNCDPCKDC